MPKKKNPPKKFRLAGYNLHYHCDVDYENYRPCQHGSDCCDNDYCRCGEIRNARVEQAPDLFSLYPKSLDKWDHYCIDRIINSEEPWNPDSYEINVCGGYYGEEIASVYFSPASTVDSKVDHIESLVDPTEKINYVLTEEYGYLLESLVGKTYEIRTIPKDKIRFGQKDHYNRLDRDVVKRYKGYDLPRGVVVEDGEFYKVVDGYHRLAAAETATVEVIVAVDKSSQTTK